MTEPCAEVLEREKDKYFPHGCGVETVAPGAPSDRHRGVCGVVRRSRLIFRYSMHPVKCGMSTPQPVVYFVRLGDREHVKIGFSTNLESRLRTFRTTTPRVIPLLTIAGGRDLEREFHWLFREKRIAGEIFRRDWRMQEFIDRVNEGEGLVYAMDFLRGTTREAQVRALLAKRKRSVR